MCGTICRDNSRVEARGRRRAERPPAAGRPRLTTLHHGRVAPLRGPLHCGVAMFLMTCFVGGEVLDVTLEAATAIAVPCGGARGTRLCYKGGSRAARVQCAPSVPCSACALQSVLRSLPADIARLYQHAARFGHLLLAVRSHPWSRGRYVTYLYLHLVQTIIYCLI